MYKQTHFTNTIYLGSKSLFSILTLTVQQSQSHDIHSTSNLVQSPINYLEVLKIVQENSDDSVQTLITS